MGIPDVPPPDEGDAGLPAPASRRASFKDDPEGTPSALAPPEPGAAARRDSAFPGNTSFTPRRRAGILAVLTAWAFCGSVSNAILFPALPLVQADLNTSAQAVNASVSVGTFVNGLAPLFWAALSDLRGRRIVYLVSGPILVAASLALFWTPNIAVFYVLRIVQQVAGSAVVSTGSGTMADIYARQDLAGALGIFYLGLTLGPTVGPALGGVITQYGGWRWTSVFSAGLAAAVWVLVVLFLPETMVPREVAAGAKRENVVLKGFKNLTYNRYPFVFSNVLVLALSFAILFTLSVTIPRDFPAVYGFTTSQAGFVQLASGVGMLFGNYFSGRFSDRGYRAWRQRRGGVAVPEDRLRATWPGVVLLVAGSLTMGWSLVTAVSWVVSALGTVIAGVGVMWFATSCNAYLIDLFASDASSIIASANFLRFTLSALGPLTVAPMQAAMGSGWLYTFWSLLNVLAYGGLVLVILFGAKYRLAMEPWKSRNGAEEQRRAIGMGGDVEGGEAVAEVKPPG
ncbi:major facilitator superfamily domain-containing protein [Hyaloraphidium curvatum]|nr:major facilitator superfamily domain-containing protein [Hyaloraphidium curvatum]